MPLIGASPGKHTVNQHRQHMHFNLAQIVMLTRSHSHVHVGRLASKQVIINNVCCKNNNYFEDLVVK